MVYRVAGVLLLLLSHCQVRAETVAVLPFFNQTESPSLSWIGESIAETIRESLSSQGLLVLDRESREEAYRRLALRRTTQLTLASIFKLGEVLDAGLVIHGSFQVSPPRDSEHQSKGFLLITARSLNLGAMKQGPETTTSGPLEDLATLEDNLVWQIMQALLGPEKAPSREQFLSAQQPIRLDALENYVRGLVVKDPDQKHRFFATAARLDPNFSQPCFQLGRLGWEKKDYRVAAGWLERVRPADTHYREATFLLGLCRYQTADYARAQDAFRSVLEHLPLSEVWNNLGATQSRLNLSAAQQSFEKALEGDPNDPVYNFNLGYALWKKGEYSQAADRFRAVLDRTPDDALTTMMLGRCLKKAGPLKGETRLEALERLKNNLDELAYRQLKAVLGQGSR